MIRLNRLFLGLLSLIVVCLFGGLLTSGKAQGLGGAQTNGVIVKNWPVTQPLPTGASTSANQTNGTQQTKLTDGTNVVSPMIVGDSVAVPVAANQYTQTYTLSGTPSSGAIIGPGGSYIDTTGFNTMIVQVVQFGTGVTSLSIQQSGDHSHWLATQALYQSTSTGSTNTYVSTIASTIASYQFNIQNRYVQIVTGQNQTASSTIIIVTLRTGSGNLNNVNVSSGVISPAVTNTPSLGTTTYSNTALSNTVVAVKGSGGNFYGGEFYNPNASTAYIQVFNLATGSVTLGSTTPTRVIAVPPSTTLVISKPVPTGFSTAISIAATTTATGSTAPGTALVAAVDIG